MKLGYDEIAINLFLNKLFEDETVEVKTITNEYFSDLLKNHLIYFRNDPSTFIFRNELYEFKESLISTLKWTRANNGHYLLSKDTISDRIQLGMNEIDHYFNDLIDKPINIIIKQN